MKLRKIFVILIMLLILQSCAANEPSAPAEKDLTGKKLTVVTPFGEGDGYQAVYQTLVDSFQNDTGCIVDDHSERSSEKWKLDVLNSFEDGGEPDVLFFFTGAAADDFIKAGKVVDLTTIREYASDYAININTSVLNTMKAGDGLNYCVPVTGFWEGLYINEDLFTANNIAVPSTMDELFDAAKEFNAAGVIPIAVNLRSTPHYWFEYMLYNYTGPSAHHIELDSAKLRESMYETLMMIKDLYEAGAFPPDIESVTDELCTSLFVEKKAAMMLDGSWAASSVKDIEDVRIAHVPAVKNGDRQETDIIGGFSMGYYITSKAWEDNRDAALAFVTAMTGEAALSAFNAGGSASPGPKQAVSDESGFIRSTEDFINSATAFVPALQDSFSKEAREYLFSKILDVAQGNIEADVVLDEFFRLNENL